jgi:peptidoglycan/LPS O-acetylase OafA/YrhL
MNSAFPYRKDIDGLRALAVLSVMMFHLDDAWLPGGFTGVDVFFVISGYVVSAALLTRQDDGLGRFLLNFYGRRIARIIPALVVMVALTLVLYLWFIPIIPWHSPPPAAIALHALVGTGNLGLLLARKDYFGVDSDLNPWVHTWSLGVEEQFYLGAPLLLFWWIRHRGSALIAWLPLVLCTGFSLVLCAVAQPRDPQLNFYLVFTRIWELGAGALLCLWLTRTRCIAVAGAKHLHTTVGSIGLILVSAGFVWARGRYSPWPDALPAVGGTLLLIYAGAHRSQGAANRFLRLPLLVAVGRLSYSLYLWHWPVYVGLRWTVGLESTVTRVGAVALSLALASVSYRFIEQPARQLPSLTQAPSRRVILACLLVMAGITATGAVLIETRQNFSASQVTRESDTWERSMAPNRNPDARCTANTDKNGQQTYVVPIYCAQGPESTPVASRHLFVLGDSHAEHLHGALVTLASYHQLSSTILWKAGCEYVLGQHPMSPTRCMAFNKTRLRYVLEHARPGDFVLLSSLRIPRYGKRHTQDKSQPTSPSAEAELVTWLEPLLNAGLRVVISAPLPIFKAAPWHCLDPWLNAKPSCKTASKNDRDALLARRARMMDAIENMLARYPQVTLWDPFPILCPAGKYCRTQQGNVVLFHDTDHLTPRGSELLSTSLLQTLNEIQDPAAFRDLSAGRMQARLAAGTTR